MIRLEYQGNITTTTDANGYYAYQLGALNYTFSVNFAYRWNTSLYDSSEVANWAWIELLDDTDDATLTLPDLEIGLSGDEGTFTQIAPGEDASIPIDSISRDSPLTFEWTSWRSGAYYWVDVGQEGKTQTLWQSGLIPDPVSDNPVTRFDGDLGGGERITTGAYWWSVGAQENLNNDYKQVIYLHPRPFSIVAAD